MMFNEQLIFDGAMGTMLQSKGLAAGALPELWNITRADVIYDTHAAYIQAGCSVLKTNTFGANRLKLANTGCTVKQVISEGVAIARKAADTAGAYVALDVGPTGKLLAPFGELGFEAAVDIFSEMITAGAEAGADMILIETMSDTYEIKAAMLAAKECCTLPVLVTFTPDETGRLLTGGDVLAAACLIEGLGADAVGFNCGLGPAQMKALLPELMKYTSIPLIVSPNAGVPEFVDGKSVFRVTPEEFAEAIADIAPHAHIIGGCCGTTPDHIASAVKACRGISPSAVKRKKYPAVSSYRKTVVCGVDDAVVGERLNPALNPRVKQALIENDMDYICDEGLDQIEHGASILAVNAAVPGIDEAETLARAVTSLQSVTGAVLRIDASTAAAAERALRLYNGRSLFKWTGSLEALEEALPIVKKYGAVPEDKSFPID